MVVRCRDNDYIINGGIFTCSLNYGARYNILSINCGFSEKNKYFTISHEFSTNRIPSKLILETLNLKV